MIQNQLLLVGLDKRQDTGWREKGREGGRERLCVKNYFNFQQISSQSMMRNWRQLSQSTVASVCIRYTCIDIVILLDTNLLFFLPHTCSRSCTRR